MPRRGEDRYDFPAIAEPPEPHRIGRRLVSAADRTGVLRDVVLDPGEFRCSSLAGELADEWVDYAAVAQLSSSTAGVGRRAIRDFCGWADARLSGDAPKASLAAEHPDLAAVFAEWERTLPSRHRAGSTTPSVFAATVRALIVRRAHHEKRPVAAGLGRLVDGEAGVPAGRTQEIDEFSRKDKHALVRAAWGWVHRTQARLDQGWALAQRGHHPAEHGWTEPADLLWGLAHRQVSPLDIRDNLPVVHDWPSQLQTCIERDDRPVFAARAKGMLVRWLVRQLYPGHLDMHAYRVLLVAATGHAPEEVTGLTLDDIEFFPAGVRLTMVKRRAGRIRHRTFGDDTAQAGTGEPVEFTDRPHREVGAIIRSLIQSTERIREMTPDRRDLFLASSVSAGYQLQLTRWNYNLPRSRFADWLAAADMTFDGVPDIRRLRKSTKVEKALAFGGRIADAANDHHEEVFRGHYAQGTTLRFMSGRVITAAQEHWFDKAVTGPTVLTGTVDALGIAERAARLGLTAGQADDIRQGALDMGLAQCSDAHNSPYGRPGQLCPVAPLRCLECRNAWVLPSNLPQLLLFAGHLDRLRLRLSPQHFAHLWGQTHTNLHAILAEHTDEEKAMARKHIEAGEADLHLPLSANVEFSS
jgi:hypothetical protein